MKTNVKATSLESQELQIFAYLKTGKTLTPIEALNLFGCLRLGARIYNLRAKHARTHVINTHWLHVSPKKKVARYRMVKLANVKGAK